MQDPARTPVRTAALGALAWLAVAPLAQAQQNATPTSTEAVDEKSFKADPPGLYANADLSYVLTSGNSSSSSLGFKGDIRATGDVLIDQLVQMQRSGFSSAVLREGVDASAAQRQFDRFAAFYQGDAVQTAPKFTREA